MKKLIVFLTFIPWFLYFYSETKNNLKIVKNNKGESDFIKRYLFDIFPIINIVLYAILVFFSIYYNDSDNIYVVRIMLFTAINIYLFFNTISKKDYVLIFENSSERISIVYVLIALLPIIFYLIFNHYMITYYIMMVFNLLDYVIIRIVGLPKNEK